MNARPKIDLERAAKLWSDGLSAAEIGELFNVTPTSVISLTRRYRDSFPVRITTRLPGADELQARLQSMTIGALAEELGVSSSAICIKLRRAGVPRGASRKPVLPKQYEPSIPLCARAVRTTSIGAKVTMPRLTFLDGPASEAI